MADLSCFYDPAAANTPAFGDLVVANGDLVLTRDTVQGRALGTEPIGQSVAQRIRTVLGEFFLDTTLGVPYFQDLFGKRNQFLAFETALQTTILATPGVLALVAWSFDVDAATRRVNVTFRAQTTAGLVDWSGNTNPTA